MSLSPRNVNRNEFQTSLETRVNMSSQHYQTVLSNPSGYYNTAQDVLKDAKLSQEQQLNILKQWEYDLRELLVAEEENMSIKGDDIDDQGDLSKDFDEVLKAIRQLDPYYEGGSSGTKQGGD